MIKRPTIAVASGRNVAERWRTQYQRDGKWTRTAYGGSEAVYNKLCDLGPSPDVARVAKIIGNKSWTHISCSGCGEQVLRAASFGSEYGDGDVLICSTCLTDGLKAFKSAGAA